ncbi:MAG: chemotaxis protein CheD [Polyangiales bacterium]|jgi:chemotaxis protein CheD
MNELLTEKLEDHIAACPLFRETLRRTKPRHLSALSASPIDRSVRRICLRRSWVQRKEFHTVGSIVDHGQARAESVSVAGIGEGVFARASGPRTLLKTYGLGSCVGVCFYDASSGVTAMLHIALPDSTQQSASAHFQPYHFADKAIPLAVATMRKLGASQHQTRWDIKMAGGASTLTCSRRFEIGARNQLAVKSALSAQRIPVLAEHCGGADARTLTMSAGSGTVEIFVGHRYRVVI